MRIPRAVPLIALVLAFLQAPALAQAPTVGAGLAPKKALTHSDYGIWVRMTGQQVTPDGRAALYALVADSLDPPICVP
jgi:hypothetical protein